MGRTPWDAAFSPVADAGLDIQVRIHRAVAGSAA